MTDREQQNGGGVACFQVRQFTIKFLFFRKKIAVSAYLKELRSSLNPSEMLWSEPQEDVSGINDEVRGM